MSHGVPPLALSVIIPTFNRAPLLWHSLESLTDQTLPLEQFEVIVVDDGSTDDTADTCQQFMEKLPLRYFRIGHSGISAAKNLGIFTARAPIVFFFDDDDLASPRLLAEHVASHERQPDENVAVLGYTTWAPHLTVSPLMHFVTEVGQQLFAYRDLTDGAELDFGYFWGGRSSCKRSLLAQHGIFNHRFRGIVEDIELGYRLSKFGLRVVFNRQAISYMNRPIELDAFCGRVLRKARSVYLFSQLHPEPAVQQYCRTQGAETEWERVGPELDPKLERARELEAMLVSAPPPSNQDVLKSELSRLYQFCFDALTAKGIVEARSAAATVDVSAAPGVGASVETPRPAAEPPAVPMDPQPESRALGPIPHMPVRQEGRMPDVAHSKNGLNHWVNLSEEDVRSMLIALIGYDFGPEPEKHIPEIRASRQDYANYIADQAGISPTDVVLDIGSGCGFGTYWFAKRAQHVHACDISPAFLSFAARECSTLGNVSFHLIQPRHLDAFESDSIDVVCAMSVFIHFNLYDIYWYFRELQRIVKSGGRIWIDVADSESLDVTTPNANGAYFLRHAHDYRDDASTLPGLMQWNSLTSIVQIAGHFGFDNLDRRAGGQLVFQKLTSLPRTVAATTEAGGIPSTS